MKKYSKRTCFLITAFILILLTQFSYAQNIFESNAQLIDATIYNRGAVLHHKTSQLQIPAGNTEIVINSIAQRVDPQSIRVNSSNDNLTILSVSFENDYLNKEGNKSVPYQQAKKKYEDALLVLNGLVAKRKGEEGALTLLEENKKFGGDKGVTTSEISTMINFYREQYKVLSNNIFAFKRQEEEQQKLVNELQRQMNETGSNKQSAGQLVLRVNAAQAVKSEFNINYFTYNVSWTPFYEIRVGKLNEPLQLSYKANVAQNTGIDWKHVKLKFSNGNPQRNNNAPQLTPWWLSFQKPINNFSNSMKREIAEEEVFYEASPNVLTQAVQVQENQLSTSFVIEMPYDIYSNGKPQVVQLQNHQLPVTYTYYTVPRSDDQAFLIGKITNWERLNLLPGNANLIIDNNYGGTSYLNPESVNDTLVLSLGRDERIVITRNQISEEGSTPFIGNSKKRNFVYEISIRNTRNEPIDIQVKEQYPLSTEKDIEVKLNDVSNAHVNNERGELSWELHLKPLETKKIKIDYSIKYPKNKVVSGL